MQTLWVETTTGTQRQLVRLLDDKTEFVRVEGGTVVVDLRALMLEVGQEVVVIGRLDQRLPESSGRIAIIEESQLETAQTLTKILRAVADWMWLVALTVTPLCDLVGARAAQAGGFRALAIGLTLVGLRAAGGAPLCRRLPRRTAPRRTMPSGPRHTTPGAFSRRPLRTGPGGQIILGIVAAGRSLVRR